METNINAVLRNFNYSLATAIFVQEWTFFYTILQFFFIPKKILRKGNLYSRNF